MKPYLQSNKTREIGITTRSVSGRMASAGYFESSLESDFLELLRFEDMVKTIEPQPFTIGYLDKEGNRRRYTPDGKVTFVSNASMKPIVYEVKYREDFREGWKVLLPKFRAAKSFCTERGWDFHIYTENEIRTEYLVNVKFLWGYKNLDLEPGPLERILDIAHNMSKFDADAILYCIASDPLRRAQLIPYLWYLVANKKIGCDLDNKLTMHSPLWYQKD